MGVLESSHLGAFEAYVFEDDSGSGGGGSGGGSDFDILFPDGLIPDDAKWQFLPEPGQQIAINFDDLLFPDLFDAPSRLSLFIARDSNRMKIFAPSGIGIFVDPTDVDLRTDFIGGGVELALPVLTYAGPEFSQSLYLGGGAFVYHSISHAAATSEFLRIRITEAETRIAPLASLEYRFEQLEPANAWMPDAGAIKLSAFKTEELATAYVSASIRFDF